MSFPMSLPGPSILCQLAASFKEARAVLDELERVQEGLLDDMAGTDEPKGSVSDDEADPDGQPSLEE